MKPVVVHEKVCVSVLKLSQVYDTKSVCVISSQSLSAVQDITEIIETIGAKKFNFKLLVHCVIV